MATIKAPGDAPPWAHRFAQAIERAMNEDRLQPVRLPEVPVAELVKYDAARWDNHSLIVPDETGGRTIATSDGTNWKRVADGTTAS